MSSPEETFRLPVEKSVSDSESAYLPKILRKVDEVLARHSHRTCGCARQIVAIASDNLPNGIPAHAVISQALALQWIFELKVRQASVAHRHPE